MNNVKNRSINCKLPLNLMKKPFEFILLPALMKLGCLLSTIAAQITDWGSCTLATCCHEAQQNFLGGRAPREGRGKRPSPFGSVQQLKLFWPKQYRRCCQRIVALVVAVVDVAAVGVVVVVVACCWLATFH